MSRRQDPIVGVLDYFENRSLEEATLAYSLVRATMKKRIAKANELVRRPKKTTKKKVSTTPTAASAPAPAAVTPEAAPAAPAAADTPAPRRRRKATAAPAVPTPVAAAEPSDLALPGLGPAIVGE